MFGLKGFLVWGFGVQGFGIQGFGALGFSVFLWFRVLGEFGFFWVSGFSGGSFFWGVRIFRVFWFFSGCFGRFSGFVAFGREEGESLVFFFWVEEGGGVWGCFWGRFFGVRGCFFGGFCFWVFLGREVALGESFFFVLFFGFLGRGRGCVFGVVWFFWVFWVFMVLVFLGLPTCMIWGLTFGIQMVSKFSGHQWVLTGSWTR